MSVRGGRDVWGKGRVTVIGEVRIADGKVMVEVKRAFLRPAAARSSCGDVDVGRDLCFRCLFVV